MKSIFPVLALCLIPSIAIGAARINIVSGQTWPPAIDAAGAGGYVVLGNAIVSGAKVAPARIANAYRVIETTAPSLSNVAIDGLIGENILREGIRIRGAATGITIRNFTLTHSATPNTGVDLPEGIHLESGKDFIIENGTISGFQMTAPPGDYWNGDGLATERLIDGLIIHNVSSDDNTDGGFDLKGSHTSLDNTEAHGNKRNYRVWAGMTAGTIISGDTNKRGGISAAAGLWLHGDPSVPVTTIEKFVVRMTVPGTIISIEDGAVDLRIAACDIRAPAGSVLVKQENFPGVKISLGPTCHL